MVAPSAQARRQVTSTVADAMLDAVFFDEDSTLVMDYACGLGALSQKLAPYSNRIIGVDINPVAVNQYNTNVANQGIPSDGQQVYLASWLTSKGCISLASAEMRAICIDLHKEVGGLEGQLFDVIVCSQAYHHFPSIDATTRLLTSFLKPQVGVLLVSDLVKGPHAHDFHQPCIHARVHGDHHTVVHRGGLTESEIRESFEQAGLVRVDFKIVGVVKKDGREVEIFLVQGVRPARDI